VGVFCEWVSKSEWVPMTNLARMSHLEVVPCSKNRAAVGGRRIDKPKQDNYDQVEPVGNVVNTILHATDGSSVSLAGVHCGPSRSYSSPIWL
jgi:hypothetical protein